MMCTNSMRKWLKSLKNMILPLRGSTSARITRMRYVNVESPAQNTSKMPKNAGCKTVYLLTGHGEKHKKELDGKGIKPDFISKNIYEAAKFIIKNSPE